MTKPGQAFLVFPFLLCAPGCGDLLAFDVRASVAEFTVPGDVDLHHQNAPLAALPVPNVEVKLEGLTQGTLKLRQLEFRVTPTGIESDDDDDTLEFLTSLQVTMVPITPGSALPALPVASWTGPAAPGTAHVALDIGAPYDLRAYVDEGFRLQLTASGVVPYDDVSLEGEMTFEVDPL